MARSSSKLPSRWCSWLGSGASISTSGILSRLQMHAPIPALRLVRRCMYSQAGKQAADKTYGACVTQVEGRACQSTVPKGGIRGGEAGLLPRVSLG